MKDNLRLLTDTGIGFLLINTVAANLRGAIRAKEVAFAEHGEETVYGKETRVLLDSVL